MQRVFDLASLYERLSADAAHKIIAGLHGRDTAQARRPAQPAECTTTTKRRAHGPERPRAIRPKQGRRPARTEFGGRQVRA